MATQPLDLLPIWAVYLLTVLLGLLVIEAGQFAGRYWAKRAKAHQRQIANIDTLVGATLSLLAFLLVFMIGIASTRFDTRRHLVIAEANAIGTTYLRAGFLDEPYRTGVRNLLRDYVAVRLEAAADSSKLSEMRARAETIQTELWIAPRL